MFRNYLIIASINFMNLTTAQSSTRAREVGIRKVAGSTRSKLISQCLTESVVLCCIIGRCSPCHVRAPLFPSFTP